jgi:hypothetical protein
VTDDGSGARADTRATADLPQSENAAETSRGQRIAAQLHRRADAARRLPALPWRTRCGGDGLRQRDPWVPCQRTVPSTFSLTPSELAAEGRRLRQAGWSPDEVLEVLASGVVAA